MGFRFLTGKIAGSAILAYVLHFPFRFIEDLFMGWLQGWLTTREEELFPLVESTLTIFIEWVAPLFGAIGLVWLAFYFGTKNQRKVQTEIAISKRSPRNLGGQAILGGIIRLDDEAETRQYTFLRCVPGKPQGTLPIVIDIEELAGGPIEGTFDWTIQVQNVVIFTRDSEPITCRVYLTGDCGSYRAKAEAKSDYVLGSPITITSEAQSGTFVFQLMERIRGAGPVNSPNRLWGDLELAFLEIGTDRSLYIPFAVIQSIPDTEDEVVWEN